MAEQESPAQTATPTPRARWRRPMCWIAVVFMAGISAYAAMPAVPAIWIAAAVALAIAHLIFCRRVAWTGLMLLAAAGLLALAATQIHAFGYSASHVGLYASREGALVQLELIIDEPPRRLGGAKTIRPMPPRQVAMASVRRVLTTTGWRECTGDVLLSCSEPRPDLAAGQTVRLLGTLARPMAAENPGQFDWAGYYRRQRILASVHVGHARQISILSEADATPLTDLRQLARRLLAAGFTPDRSLDHALLRALVLGDSDPQLRDVQQQFIRTGTSHHLAISGMHIAILAAFVLGICRVLCVPRPRTTLIVLAFVGLYGLVAMPSPPVLRSVFMCLAFGVGMLLRREADALQMLALSVLALLAIWPLDLYQPGFQLSFGTVLGLIVLTPRVLKSLHRVDPDEAAWGIQRSGWRRFWRWAGRWHRDGVVAGLVAWAVSAPLVAMHFGRASPWVVPASLLLAPVVLAALLGGFLKIVATLLLPGFSLLWASIVREPIWLMREMVDWMEKLPGGDLPAPALPGWLVLLYYAALALPLWGPRLMAGPLTQEATKAPAARWLRLGPAACCLAMFASPFWGSWERTRPDEFRLTILSVGAGSCAVIELPDGRVMLADAGSAGIADMDRVCLDPFLRQRLIRRVDAIAISHHDADHISAAAGRVAQDGATIICSADFRRLAEKSDAASDLLDAVDRSGRPPDSCAMGQTRDLGGGVTMEILWPPSGRTFGDNDSSMVFRLRFAGRSVLFTGDIEERGMNELLASGGDPRADILIAPHHGSAETSTARFIAAVAPRAVIASNDRTLTRKQFLFDQICHGRPLYRTHEAGAVTTIIRPDGTICIDTFRSIPGK